MRKALWMELWIQTFPEEEDKTGLPKILAKMIVWTVCLQAFSLPALCSLLPAEIPLLSLPSVLFHICMSLWPTLLLLPI